MAEHMQQQEIYAQQILSHQHCDATPCLLCAQVGDWDAVLDKCKAGRIQPSVLLYEDTQS
jgi:hypothetical protein